MKEPAAVETRIQTEPIGEDAPAGGAAPARDVSQDVRWGETGAELVFYGRVRDVEEGRVVVALDYEHYAGMAERELHALAEETAGRFPILAFDCTHRVGRVPVGEASLRIAIHSRHRTEALDAVAWFVRELKTRVPIWKWGVTASGDRFPSTTRDTAGG